MYTSISSLNMVDYKDERILTSTCEPLHLRNTGSIGKGPSGGRIGAPPHAKDLSGMCLDERVTLWDCFQRVGLPQNPFGLHGTIFCTLHFPLIMLIIHNCIKYKVYFPGLMSLIII